LSNKKVKKTDSLYERILLEKVREGDKAAFSYIFSAYYRDLVLFSVTFTKDIDNSEEIVQNIFVEFWENRDTINVNTSLKSYLLKTVQNKCLDLIRHLKIREKYSNKVIENSALTENDTENYILRSELEQNIDQVLSQLPEEIAEAFRMNRFDGLKYQEIAEKQNVSVRTIEVRIGKALNLLRKLLKDFLVATLIILSSLST
jgi:RNA polymerase sigma-70 factor (family 1)